MSFQDVSAFPISTSSKTRRYNTEKRASITGSSSLQPMIIAKAISALSISNSSVYEQSIRGTVVGILNLPSGASVRLIDAAQGRFSLIEINGIYKLIVNDGRLLDYESAVSHTVIFEVTESTGNFWQQALQISVLDLPEWYGTPERDYICSLFTSCAPVLDAPLSVYYLADGDDGSGRPNTDNWIFGGDGDDTLYGGIGNDILYGENGNDRLDGNEDINILVGGRGSDTLVASGSNTQIYTDDIYNQQLQEADVIELNEKDFKSKHNLPTAPVITVWDYIVGLDHLKFLDLECVPGRVLALRQTLTDQYLQLQVQVNGQTEMDFRFFGVQQYLLEGLDISTRPCLGIPGDFNLDGCVNGDDYQLWKSLYKSTVSIGMLADGNEDGVINLADYTIWRDNLGAGICSK